MDNAVTVEAWLFTVLIMNVCVVVTVDVCVVYNVGIAVTVDVCAVYNVGVDCVADRLDLLKPATSGTTHAHICCP